jgi:hypothetical protein
MLPVEPTAYARSRQAELMNTASDARLARRARSAQRPAAANRPPVLRWLTAHLQLRPATPAACCC